MVKINELAWSTINILYCLISFSNIFSIIWGKVEEKFFEVRIKGGVRRGRGGMRKGYKKCDNWSSWWFFYGIHIISILCLCFQLSGVSIGVNPLCDHKLQEVRHSTQKRVIYSLHFRVLLHNPLNSFIAPFSVPSKTWVSVLLTLLSCLT